MTVSEKIELLGLENIVIFENPSYEKAFIGVSDCNRAVYDYNLMIQCLVEEEEMEELEAIEFIDYNTIRSLGYVENSPIIVYGMRG